MPKGVRFLQILSLKNQFFFKARTLIFVAWDGEEHAIGGSSEFVKEFVNILQQRAVVYINVDMVMPQNNTM